MLVTLLAQAEASMLLLHGVRREGIPRCQCRGSQALSGAFLLVSSPLLCRKPVTPCPSSGQGPGP